MAVRLVSSGGTTLAAFGVSRTPTRGRDAITREWMPLIQGTTLKLSWYPAVVTLGGDGRTAYSSGPALYEDPKTGESRIGRFGSVWHRGDDGVWRVLFDDGVSPQKADAAAIRPEHQAPGSRIDRRLGRSLDQ